MTTALFVIFALARSQSILPHNQALKTLNLIGSSFDPLYVNIGPVGDSAGLPGFAGNGIFSPSYSQGTNFTSPQGIDFSVPDAISVTSNVDCALDVSSFTAKTFHDYEEQDTQSFSVKGGFMKISGKYSQNRKHVRDTMTKNSVAVSQSHVECSIYVLRMWPGAAQLSPNFVRMAKSLPENFTTSDPGAVAKYFEFFDLVGTYFRTQCVVGGRLFQQHFTSSTYAKSHTEDEMTQQASATFYISVDASQSTKHDVTDEYKSSTSSESIISLGGVYPNEADNFLTWGQSIQQQEQLDMCLQFESTPIHELFTSKWVATQDADLLLRASAAEAAHTAYYDRKGCTNAMAQNFNASALVDDGSCNMTDVPYGNPFKHRCMDGETPMANNIGTIISAPALNSSYKTYNSYGPNTAVAASLQCDANGSNCQRNVCGLNCTQDSDCPATTSSSAKPFCMIYDVHSDWFQDSSADTLDALHDGSYGFCALNCTDPQPGISSPKDSLCPGGGICAQMLNTDGFWPIGDDFQTVAFPVVKSYAKGSLWSASEDTLEGLNSVRGVCLYAQAS